MQVDEATCPSTAALRRFPDRRFNTIIGATFTILSALCLDTPGLPSYIVIDQNCINQFLFTKIHVHS